MKNLFKQPLVHFLLAGLGFFILFKVLNPEEQDYKTIVIDKNALLTHLQYRSKAFNNEVFEQRLAEMPQQELDQIVQEYVREEVLYREAMAMGLDQEDYIIKRRMIQKVEFMTEGVTDALIDLTDEELTQYFQENKEDYFIPPVVTFTHVYFSNEHRDAETAEKMAAGELVYLNKNTVPFEQATSRGERFHYHTNYVERDPEYVTSHFGNTMSEEIFKSSPSDEWIGPFASQYGYHLVLLSSKSSGQYPELSEIRERVQQDAVYWKKQQLNQQTIQALIETYKVDLAYQKDI